MRLLDELPIPQRIGYMAGYTAFLHGATIDKNPHHPRSYAGILWDEGWTDAEQDMLVHQTTFRGG